jgi:FeS assembly SUF system protein
MNREPTPEPETRDPAAGGAAPAASPATGASPASSEGSLEDRVIGVLRDTFDPEIPVNIYDLGLVYSVEVDDKSAVHVRMTLTSPACPVAGTLPGEVERKIAALPDVTDADVQVVWDPPWDPSKLSDAARLQLGMM